ncbi:MAG: DUF3617 domain-containing protein [Pseudomonadota bacterium]
MNAHRLSRFAVAVALFAAFSAATAPQNGAQRQPLTALSMIEPGQWQLKESDSGALRRLCVDSPTSLLQIQHGPAQCSHFVVENSPTVATVHYTCPGHGHGRTTVTVETPRLARVETQGVADGAPFSIDFEARRIGSCGAGGR